MISVKSRTTGIWLLIAAVALYLLHFVAPWEIRGIKAASHLISPAFWWVLSYIILGTAIIVDSVLAFARDSTGYVVPERAERKIYARIFWGLIIAIPLIILANIGFYQ